MQIEKKRKRLKNIDLHIIILDIIYHFQIGVDFMLKTLDWDNPKMKITLQFWDIAGII